MLMIKFLTLYYLVQYPRLSFKILTTELIPDLLFQCFSQTTKFIGMHFGLICQKNKHRSTACLQGHPL